jgi:hypothetical protein
LVTSITLPPLPPRAFLPNPSAPGNAIVCAWREIAEKRMTRRIIKLRGFEKIYVVVAAIQFSGVCLRDLKNGNSVADV